MKKIKCLVPFAGTVSMAAGEEREVSDEVAADLIRAGYAEDTDAVEESAEEELEVKEPAKEELEVEKPAEEELPDTKSKRKKKKE